MKPLERAWHGFQREDAAVGARADAWGTMSLRLLDLVAAEAPESLPLFEHLTNCYDEAVDVDTERRKVLERCAEDLRDIIERKRAIDRLSTEHEAATKRYEKKKRMFQKVRSDAARAQAVAALQACKDACRLEIEHRQRFGAFVKRRLHHCFSTYAELTIRTNNAEQQIMQRAITELTCTTSATDTS